ncbi:hypothetical protein BGZ61DRAFT_303270, partial [Ilyonectria robusta]|uniref:uncharacterized protein n=1 Tax=Ilyonectria robusta TaxID=1079257 RepID=UPI001E8D1F25
IEKLREQWRESKEVIVDSIKKNLRFKKWLEYTGKDKEYLSMDTQRSEMTQLLNEKTDGFMIDTQLPPEVKESMRQARYAPKPLNAVDWTALAGSDDSIHVNLGQLPTDSESEEEEEEEEDLEFIDLTQVRKAQEIPLWQRSSPPVTPLYESSPYPEIASTPCPPQQHIPGHKKIQQIIRETRATQEASLE